MTLHRIIIIGQNHEIPAMPFTSMMAERDAPEPRLPARSGASHSLPTIERLHELFELLPDGRLLRRVSTAPRVKAGDIAGCVGGSGYLVVSVENRSYRVHRIVFAMHHGRWPEANIDHINGDRADNSPGNLREVSNRENGQNHKSHRNGRLPGATWHKHTSKWLARAQIDGHLRHIGMFSTEAEAHAAYCRFLAANGLPPPIALLHRPGARHQCKDCEGTGMIEIDAPPPGTEPTHHYWIDVVCPACEGRGQIEDEDDEQD